MSDVETVHDLKGDELITALEERAEMIIAQAHASYDTSQLHNLIGDAKMLLTQVPQGHARSGSAMSRIQSAIAEAQKHEAELEASDLDDLPLEAGPRSEASQQFQRKMFNLMSSEEKQYLNSIEDDKQYKMASIDENGNVTETENTVEGAQLKEDFSRVKYHALSEEQQQGIDLPEHEHGHDHKSPDQEVHELGKLKKSLHNLEGHKAQELMERGASAEECKRCHEHFEGARDQVDKLQGRLENVEQFRADGNTQMENMEKAMIQVDKGRLRNTLQKDVIDGELLDQDHSAELGISGGQHVEQEQHGQLAANVAQIDENVRQQQNAGRE